MQPCKVDTTRDRDMLIFRIHGELDLDTVGTCRAELDHSLRCAVRDRGGERSSKLPDASWTLVVLDLRGFAFLSAAGLRMLGELADALSAQGIAIGIAAEPGSLTRRVLHLAGLDRRAVLLDAPEPTR
jgi:anti-anti-sigma regulatory factor